MRLSIILLFCCIIAVHGQSPQRPSFFSAFVSAIQRIFSPRRPASASASASAGNGSPSGSLDPSQLVLSDIQLQEAIAAQQIQLQQQLQPEPIIKTVSVTETEVSTVFSTIPDLERVTNIETVLETVTISVTETVKMTQTKTEVMSKTICPSIMSNDVPSKDEAIIVDAAEKIAKPSKVMTAGATNRARLAPYVVKRAVEIEASTL